MLNSFAHNISHENLAHLPLIQFEGKIHLIDNLTDIEKALRRMENIKIFGFDTESKPSFKKGKTNKVSVLQLATLDECFIFRLHKTWIPDGLKEILDNESIIKIGLAIKDDCSALRQIRNIDAKGFIDLQQYITRFGIEDKGLKKLSGIVLGARISKSQQTSNWEASSLSMPQLIYAATDAWVCLKIYNRLKQVEDNHANIS